MASFLEVKEGEFVNLDHVVNIKCNKDNLTIVFYTNIVTIPGRGPSNFVDVPTRYKEFFYTFPDLASYKNLYDFLFQYRSLNYREI